ncbi:MAG TPA: GDSL-type esterase/lipase family protein [Gemmataceae bacterium]|nr:GDSL-type esterase/lipase family protein [Gemmataceae bacterium]
MARHILRTLCLLTFATALAAVAHADDKKPENSAVKPRQRKDKAAVTRHEAFLQRAQKGGVDVLFLGDSITQGWEGNGKEVWKKNFEPMHAANFGIGGDRTEDVLWRITEGKELAGINPKAVVLMIGTNNVGSNTAEQIAEGVAAIVKEIRRQKPGTKILLLGVFPRGAKGAKGPYKDKFRAAADELQPKIKQINERIARLDDGQNVRYLDIGGHFLDKDDSLPRAIMPDLLHLSPKGYEIWAEAIKAPLAEMVNKK